MVGKNTSPLVILTRPDGKNQALADRFEAAGMATLCLPALAIQPLPTEQAKLPVPADYDLVVFVSGNAVRMYCQQLDAASSTSPWPATTLIATVGAASAQSLRNYPLFSQARVLHPTTDQQQDSEALWELLQPLVASLKRVLIVRGENGREWLGERLQLGGASVQRYAVYRRAPVAWSVDECQSFKSGLRSDRPLVCLLTSSEGVDAFYANLQNHGLQRVVDDLRFVTIHPRVASHLQSVHAAISGNVTVPAVEVCAPDDDAIFQTVATLAFL